MHDLPLQRGPLDGMAIRLPEPIPEHLALDLTDRFGGPGVAYYSLDTECFFPRYCFDGWRDEDAEPVQPEVRDTGRFVRVV